MAMPASKFSLAVKAQGKHGAVFQGSLGLDKVKTIFLLLNSGSMGAILLLARDGKFEGSLSDPIPSPFNLSKWFMCHCLPPFFSNLFPCSICLLSVSGYLSWVAAPLMTTGLVPAQRAEDWQGMRRGRDALFCCCCQQSGPCFLLTLPCHCHLYFPRSCPGNPLQWNDCQGAQIIFRLSLTNWGSHEHLSQSVMVIKSPSEGFASRLVLELRYQLQLDARKTFLRGREGRLCDSNVMKTWKDVVLWFWSL